MAANSVSRERYQEYARYLRVSAGNLNLSVSPTRLRRLRSQVNVERNKFLVWEVIWALIALASLVPMMLLAAVEFGLALPASVAGRAEASISSLSRWKTPWWSRRSSCRRSCFPSP